MNREILYLAWEKDTKKMCGVTNISFMMYDDTTHCKETEIYDLDTRVGHRLVRLSDIVLLQYTGVNDKNGKKVFEGDKVIMHYFFGDFNLIDMGYTESEEEVTGIVGIDEYGTFTLVKEEKYYWINYLQIPSEELEVLGNVYKNPEILEVN